MSAVTALVSVVLFAFIIALSQTLHFLDILPIIGILLLGKHNAKGLFYKLFVASGFILFVFITTVFFTTEYAYAQLLLFRSVLIISFTMITLDGFDTFQIYHALTVLRLPSKITLLYLFTAKYILLIQQEYRTMLQSLRARGFKSQTSLLTYRTYGNLIGMLFFKSQLRSENFYQSLQSRGFQGSVPMFEEMHLCTKDYLLLTVTLIPLGQKLFA